MRSQRKRLVQADEALLGNLADEGGDILVFHIGIGVKLRSRGGVGGVAVVDEEAQLVGRLAVVLMALAVEHEGFGGLEMTLAHQGYFHLVLDVFNAHAVAEFQVVDDVLKAIGVDGDVDGGEGLEDGSLDLVEGELLGGAVTLGDKEGIETHECGCFGIWVFRKVPIGASPTQDRAAVGAAAGSSSLTARNNYPL